MPLRRFLLFALVASALAVAGCGGSDKTVTQASPGDVPGITTEGSERAYELGADDGSGADGEESPADRGGIAGGPDTKEPGDSEGADEQFSPPRGGRLEE